MAKFNIINKAEELTNYVLVAAEKSPKKVRLDIVPEIRKKALSILEHIVKANCYPVNGDNATLDSFKSRQNCQSLALMDIRILNTFLEIANMHNYITNSQLEASTRLSTELYDMIIKWQESDSRRQKNKC